MIGHLRSQRGFARGKLLAVLLVVAVVAVAGVMIAGRSKSGQLQDRAATNPTGYRATADQFMKLITRNNAAGTFAMMTRPGQQDVGGIDKWTATVNDSFSKSKNDPVFLSEHDIDDPNGIYKDKQPKLVTYRLQMFNATWEMSLTVIKDGDSWKVDRLSTDLRR